MASTFSCQCSLSSCFCASLWISLDTGIHFQRLAQKHEERLHQHENVEAIQLLDNKGVVRRLDNKGIVRRLQREKPFDLVSMIV
jgi:hypothetical protein